MHASSSMVRRTASSWRCTSVVPCAKDAGVSPERSRPYRIVIQCCRVLQRPRRVRRSRRRDLRCAAVCGGSALVGEGFSRASAHRARVAAPAATSRHSCTPNSDDNYGKGRSEFDASRLQSSSGLLREAIHHRNCDEEHARDRPQADLVGLGGVPDRRSRASEVPRPGRSVAGRSLRPRLLRLTRGSTPRAGLEPSEGFPSSSAPPRCPAVSLRLRGYSRTP